MKNKEIPVVVQRVTRFLPDVDGVQKPVSTWVAIGLNTSTIIAQTPKVNKNDLIKMLSSNYKIKEVVNDWN
jgi:hypothetical protein